MNRISANGEGHPTILRRPKTTIEWNMDLMRPNLAPGFQFCFVLETMRRFAEEKLDMAAYYHIRDCFVDLDDFDWQRVPASRRGLPWPAA